MGNLRVSGDRTACACIDFITDSICFSVQFPALMWQNRAIMLIEIWERLRGYDKWVQDLRRLSNHATIEHDNCQKQRSARL